MVICNCGSVFSRSDNLKRHQRNCLSDINHVKKVTLENPVKIGSSMDLANDNKVFLNFDKTNESDVKGVDFNTNFKDENLDIENVRKCGNGYDANVSQKELTKPRIERSGKSKISFDSDDDVDNEVIRTPERKRVRFSFKSRDGSVTQSKKPNAKMDNYSGKSDIFSKNKNDSSESDSEDSQSEVSNDELDERESDKHSESDDEMEIDNYSGKSDIFSKNKDSSESDSEDNQSEVSDDELDEGESRICYCRDCKSKSSRKHIKNQYIHSSESENQSEVSDDNESEVSDDELDVGQSRICYCRDCESKPSKKNVKNQYVRSNESDNQSESDDEMEIDIKKESNVKLETNPYNQYYKSQALGDRVFSTIIGDHTGTNNVGGSLSSLYRSSFRIPVTMRNGISRENDTNYGNTSSVSSYLNY